MKTFMILFPLALAAVVFGAAWVGVIEVPGLSPKVLAVPPTAKSRIAARSALELEPLPPKTTRKLATSDPELGQKKLALLWEGIENDKLLPIVSKWRDGDLAPVLGAMNPEKVASLLSVMDPARASRLSKELQRRGSRLDLAEP